MGRGNVLRWAIGSPDGLRSSTWRIWGNAKGDIYVAVRCLGSVMKASFHRDGKCHLGFTEEYAKRAARGIENASRHWEKWKLPAAPVTRGLRILVPHAELRRFAGHDDGAVVWLRPPDPGSIGTISIIFAPSQTNLELPADLPSARVVGLVSTGLRDAWVLYAHSVPDATWTRVIATERAKLAALPRPTTISPNMRAVVWDSRPDHDRHALELAYDL